MSLFLPNIDEFPYPRWKLNVSRYPVTSSDDVMLPPGDSGGKY